MNKNITLGIVTHARTKLLGQSLQQICKCVVASKYNVNLIVANNSGEESYSTIEDIVQTSGIKQLCPVKILNSSENNISVGRNLILDNTESDILLFMDDDEQPVDEWINALVNQFEKSDCSAVAGPIEPVYPDSAPKWVQALDLHNRHGRKTGQRLAHIPTGNCLIHLPALNGLRFDHAYGLTGGGDTLFFQSLSRSGKNIVWCEDALVFETIEEHQVQPKYVKFRFMKQGNTFRQVVLVDKSLSSKIFFYAKAGVITIPSIIIGHFFLPFNSKLAANWLKRGYSNLGKLVNVKANLYGKSPQRSNT